MTRAALGGKQEEGTVTVDSGEGIEERSEEDDKALRLALGDDYERVINGR